MIATFLVNTLSVIFGTFLGNFALLSVIGKRAESIERERIKQMQAAREQMAKAIKEKQEKMREYVKMES
jgi:hypothetical protein